MEPENDRWFAARQVAIVIGAIAAYFGVRGLTEGNVHRSDDNARALLDLERSIGLDIEQWLQDLVGSSQVAVTLMNWIYIWLHWPVLIATLWWLLRTDRTRFVALRNAMIASGLIGMTLYMSLPLTPPRLLGTDYIDTVTLHSHSYRILQPPLFVNRYAAFPSLHFGWNLLAGIVWYGLARHSLGRAVAVLMPVAMGVAVVATANHWVLDVVGGGVVALTGKLAADAYTRRHQIADDEPAEPSRQFVP